MIGWTRLHNTLRSCIGTLSLVGIVCIGTSCASTLNEVQNSVEREAGERTRRAIDQSVEKGADKAEETAREGAEKTRAAAQDDDDGQRSGRGEGTSSGGGRHAGNMPTSEKDMLYNRLQAEGTVVAENLRFATGSAKLQSGALPTLQSIAWMLQEHADLDLRIEGHTDSAGSRGANRRLSRERAEAVVAYLVSEHGIDAGRLVAVGKGEAEPVAGNATYEGRQANRRIVLVRL